MSMDTNLYHHAATFHLELKMVDPPACPKCKEGVMLPLQDELQTGAIIIKAWVCNNCQHNVAMRSGNLVDIKNSKL